MPRKDDVYSRAWIFVINNYTDEDCELVKALSDDKVKYMVCGKEVGEQGTPHLQGFVNFVNERSFTKMKKSLPRAHLKIAKGSDAQNEAYCSKDENLLIRVGEPSEQGRRTDIDYLRQQLREGAGMRQITNTAGSIQCVKMAEVWLKYNEEPRKWKPEVRWYYGSTGSGKTRQAREWLGDEVYTCLDTIKWFEGYDKHENVLIDDFRKDYAKFHQMLKLLDRYEYKVETKGGSRQFLAKKIAITAPYRPEQMYIIREDVQQLLRRIDEIILVGQEVDTSSIGDEPDLIDP